MSRYYTRACNFYYGLKSKTLLKKKKTLPLNGNSKISFDRIEIISRKSSKTINLNEIYKLPINLKKKIKNDLKIISLKKNIKNLSFGSIPKVMGILNVTPDSFSDGGKYNRINSAKKHLDYLFKSGADIVDIGGESTRPGSQPISSKVEWRRVNNILKKSNKKYCYQYKIKS